MVGRLAHPKLYFKRGCPTLARSLRENLPCAVSKGWDSAKVGTIATSPGPSGLYPFRRPRTLAAALAFFIRFIKISNFHRRKEAGKLRLRDYPNGWGVVMSELENGLHRVLEEHQHESGLHIIGGRNKLVARLAEFFEQMAAQDSRNQELRPEQTTH